MTCTSLLSSLSCIFLGLTNWELATCSCFVILGAIAVLAYAVETPQAVARPWAEASSQASVAAMTGHVAVGVVFPCTPTSL